ncbi:MAG TPA: NYN domain-containing protein, partial [Gemmatimonadales bacterium]|nr:NYN domain-containing protein [Gemmatimonadales bacterium]
MPEAPATSSAPNAALLIDFDNVTLGIQSDLARELRALIQSDALGRHVTIQRAYADWRRFPQYLVPLTEASVELISAPAVGPNKKNATDIRLAIDAMELAFTRPEVGTFILLSGDSDFSSLVVKLKEWGKYVIGVGMKESSSDTLMRVCHEYYSYSDLAGLKKSDDAVREPGIPQDPWELVKTAVAQMVKNRDVMRADRLKQVMQQLDPAFDERRVGKGYGRFSKFVTDAADKGLISARLMENGQLEVAPADGASPPRSRQGAQVDQDAAEV